MTSLKVKRVGYGKADTPVELREYQMQGQSAVGTRADWVAYADQNGYYNVEFVELEEEVCKSCGKEEVVLGGMCEGCAELVANGMLDWEGNNLVELKEETKK